jgi:hypothetical protein
MGAPSVDVCGIVPESCRVIPADGSHPLGEKLIGLSDSSPITSESFLIVTLPIEIPRLVTTSGEICIALQPIGTRS